MEELPVFLQMFVRLFAALIVGLGLLFSSPREERKNEPREKIPAREQHAPATDAINSSVDPAAKPAGPHVCPPAQH